MSREQGRDTFRRIISHSSNRNIRDTANMPIFMEDTHESSMLSTSRDFNPDYDSRLHNIPISAALEALQSYGPVVQSPSHSPMKKDWSVNFCKNINNPPEKSPAFSTGILKCNDSYMQTHATESSLTHTSNIPSCQPFNDLNLKNVDEEDEYLYGDSNSLPEIPKLLKNDCDEINAKTDHPGWSDEEDLFGESSDTSLGKLNPDHMKSSTIWSLRNKNIQSKLTQKPEVNANLSSSRNKLSEAFSVESYSVSSGELENIKQLPNKQIEKSKKSVVSEKNSQIASTSGVKSKYHVAAQVLRKEITEKSKLSGSKTGNFSSKDNVDMKTNNMLQSFRNDIPGNKLTAKSNVPVKDSKELKINKSPGKNIRKLPKAFLQKDLDGIVDYIKGSHRKRNHSQDEYEHGIKHPRSESYRELSPSKEHSPYHSSRNRSPMNEYRHRSPYHSRYKSPERDSRYRSSPYYSKHKSPHRDYERNPFERSPRHCEGRRHYSRSPDRKSREWSPSYYKYRARSPGSYRSKERSRSPGSHRPKERSRSPGSHRPKERSRSPGYYRPSDRSYEHKFKKDPYKSREMSLKCISEHSHSRKWKKAQNYSSDDSFCSLSLDSESGNSDSSDETPEEKEKSTTKPIQKKKIPEDTKSSKTESSKAEKIVLEDVRVKNTDTSLLSNDISQNLADICNFQDKTTRDVEISNDIFKSFDKDKEDKLRNIVQMFENSQIISELVEEVQEHASSLAPVIPPLDVAHNTTNLLTPKSSIPNVSFSSISSSQSYSVMPPVPIPFHPPHVSSFPPLTFPPPPVVPPPVVRPPMVPPPVIPPPIVPPPVAPPLVAPSIIQPTSVYGPFPVSIPSVDVCRAPDIKKVKLRTTTLRPISLTKVIPSKSLNDHSKSAESTERIIEKEKTKSEKPAVESVVEQNTVLIDTFKKLKTERHLAHAKVNSCVADMVEMRKMMDDTWGKKVNASDRIIYSKCKNLLSMSSDSMSYYLKEAKRLDEELSRFKGRLPRELMDEIANIKVEHPKVDNPTEYYSCFDSSNHTCYVCYKQFSNLSGILEHLHSTEHTEQMSSNDKDWTKTLKKPEQNEEGKKIVLKPVAGVEFMKPFTGYYCTLCSEALPDGMIAEQHLKSHDHFSQYKDYMLQNPLYDKKCLFKKYIQHSILSKEKKKREMQKKEQQVINRKKMEETDEKIKEMLRDQMNKEKIVEELEYEDDVDSPSSKNQSSSGIKLTLSGDKEKVKMSEEKGTKASSSKAFQKFPYIGKAPNYKARPTPWYKRDIYQKNVESPSDSNKSTLSAITVKTKEKNSVSAKESSGNEPDVLTNRNFLEGDISEAVKKKEKEDVKKTVESTCLTEEESKKLSTSCSEINNMPVLPTEKNSTIFKESATCSTVGEFKIPLPPAENIPTDSGESGMTRESTASGKQLTGMEKEKDACNQPHLSVNKKKENNKSVTEDSAVNQALKNILLGTDSSVRRDIPLSEIKLPDNPIPSSSNSFTNSMLHGESNIPVPMDIDDTNDRPLSDSLPKLITEEDRDLFILGINKEDLIPLVIPVPPPSSLLNCSSPSYTPTFPNQNVTHDSLHAANKVSKNANGSTAIPVSISSHLSKSPNSKKQTLEIKSNKNNRTLITIVPTDNLLKLDSFLKSDTEKSEVTSEELRHPITTESSDICPKDVITEVCIPSPNINIESSTEIVTGKEDNILHKSDANLIASEVLSLEMDSITECTSQTNHVCESIENVNKGTPSEKGDFSKEPNPDLCLVEIVSQVQINNEPTSDTDHIILKSEQIGTENTSISLCKSTDSPDLANISVEINSKAYVDENSSVNNMSGERLISDQDSALTQQSADLSLKESVVIRSENVLSYSLDSSSKPSLSSEQSLDQDSCKGSVSDVETHNLGQKDVLVDHQQSDIKLLQNSITRKLLDQDSCEENITDTAVCDSNKVIHMEEPLFDSKSHQDLMLKQPLQHHSSNEVCNINVSASVSEIVHSNNQMPVEQNPVVVSPDLDSQKEFLSKASVPAHIDMEDQQSSTKLHVAEQFFDQASSKEITSGLEVCTSINKTLPVENQPCDTNFTQNLAHGQSLNQNSCKEKVADMELDSAVFETVHVQDQESGIKPCQDLVTDQTLDQEPCKENFSETKADTSTHVHMIDQQSYSDIKPHQSLPTEQLLDEISNKESVFDMELCASVNETAPVYQQLVKSNIELISEESSNQDSCKEGVTDMEVSVSVCETGHMVDQSSKPDQNLAGDIDLVFPMQSSKEDIGTEIIDPKLSIIGSEQAVHLKVTLFDKDVHEELISAPPSTYDSSKESISDVKMPSSISESVDINVTVPVNNSSEDVLASNSDSISKQCLFENLCPTDTIRMEISPQQQALVAEKQSQCDVKSDQGLNPLQLLNQDSSTENISDVSKTKLHHESLSFKKSNEAESVKNISCVNVSICSSDLTPESLSEGVYSGTANSDEKELRFELQSAHMKGNDVIRNEGLVSQESTSQCGRVPEVLSTVDACLPDDLNPVKVPIAGESIPLQEATLQQHDVTSESIPTVEKEPEDTLSDFNTSIMNLMDEKQESQANVKQPELEIKIDESVSAFHLASSSGDVPPTQSLPKSDTDTDEYETEE